MNNQKNTVTPELMADIYERIKTPYKYGDYEIQALNVICCFSYPGERLDGYALMTGSCKTPDIPPVIFCVFQKQARRRFPYLYGERPRAFCLCIYAV